MKRLAIVPARGGSKRLVRKNMRLLKGKALINHTVDVVRTCFESVIVSSDASEILNLVVAAPNVITDLRPSHLATDHSKVLDTVDYYFEKYRPDGFDQIWLCLPTCPLRTAGDLSAGIGLLTEAYDGIVSVTEYEFPPSLGLIVRDGLVTGYHAAHPLASGDSRSQDQPVVYRPNGAFYGMWWNSFADKRNYFRGKVREYVMPRERSVDIDTELDFLMAGLMIDRS